MIRRIVNGCLLFAICGPASALSPISCDLLLQFDPLRFLFMCVGGNNQWEWVNPFSNDSLVENADGDVYKLDPKTGRITPYRPPKSGASAAPVEISPIPKAQGVGASDTATDMTGRFEYVGLSGSDKIGAYRIDPGTGQRSDIPGAPFAAGKRPTGLVVHPSNTFIYATNSGSDNISAYRIDQSNGALTSVGIFAAGSSPHSAAIHPSGRSLYVTNVGGGVAPPTVIAYAIDTDTGALTPLGNPIATGNFPTSIAVDPRGRFVYFTTSGKVEGYEVATNGTLSKLAGTPFAVPGGPGTMRLAIARAGQFLYTTNSFSNNVSGFAINATTGALTPVPGSPFASGVNPSWIMTDSSGTFILVANPGSLTGGTDSISAYAADAVTGALRPIAESPFVSSGPATPDVLGSAPVFAASFAPMGEPYTQTVFQAVGGTRPYTWTIESGTLPAGIALNAATGTLSGTPITKGTFDFSLKVTDAAGAASSRASFITVNTKGTPGDLPATRSAIEFFHAGFGHYFIATEPDEIIKLDTGVFKGWTPTGQSFNVYAKEGAALFPVCRFFTIAFPPSSSHFYAPRGLGCEGTLADTHWQFEGDVFYTPLPDASGQCPAGTIPVFRLYNLGQGGAPNHRFTTNATTRAQMLASGYLAEGAGIGVGMCALQ